MVAARGHVAPALVDEVLVRPRRARRDGVVEDPEEADREAHAHEEAERDAAVAAGEAAEQRLAALLGAVVAARRHGERDREPEDQHPRAAEEREVQDLRGRPEDQDEDADE